MLGPARMRETSKLDQRRSAERGPSSKTHPLNPLFSVYPHKLSKSVLSL